MKRILVYGDSNTWGDNPTGIRYSLEDLWVNILASKMQDVVIDQHGLCARIAGGYEKSQSEHRNGHQYFQNSVMMSGPFDVLIIALGTNDLNTYYGRSSDDLIDDLLWYGNRLKSFADTKFSSVPPNNPILVYLSIPNFVSSDYFEGNEALRAEVNSVLENTVENFIDLGNLELTSDGVHFSINDHKQVANTVYDALKEKL